MKKNQYFFLIITVCSILLCSCSCSFKNIYGNRPVDQKNTTWESEDGTLHFVVDEHGESYGELIINNEKIKVEVSTGLGTYIRIYIAEESKEISEDLDIKGNVVGTSAVLNEKNKIEYWVGDYKKANTFTATVKETTYYKVGQKIKINRIDN